MYHYVCNITTINLFCYHLIGSYLQGKELDQIFKEEGMTDGEESDSELKVTKDKAPKEQVPKLPEVIGHTVSGELVVVVKGKGRGRPKGKSHYTD